MSVKTESHAETSCEHEMLPLTVKYLHFSGIAWVRISYTEWKTTYYSLFQPSCSTGIGITCHHLRQ